MAGETTTFKQAYGVLQRHADTLRTQSEPNIDDLLSIVEESVAAYKVCKDRIDAVEKALHAALTEVGDDSASVRAAADAHASSARPTPPARARAANSSAQAKSGFEDMDDDIPF